jgi:hypothetical protein
MPEEEVKVRQVRLETSRISVIGGFACVRDKVSVDTLEDLCNRALYLLKFHAGVPGV